MYIKSRPFIAVIFSLSVLLVFAFQNCAVESNQGARSASSRIQAPPGLPPINYFKETPPPLICGKGGWAFLMRNYITQYCSACHYNGSFAPIPFADNNLDLAYSTAQWIAKTQWHTFTTQNKLCVPNCNILPEGEIYQGIMEWADHASSCP